MINAPGQGTRREHRENYLLLVVRSTSEANSFVSWLKEETVQATDDHEGQNAKDQQAQISIQSYQKILDKGHDS